MEINNLLINLLINLWNKYLIGIFTLTLYIPMIQLHEQDSDRNGSQMMRMNCWKR